MHLANPIQINFIEINLLKRKTRLEALGDYVLNKRDTVKSK